MMMMMMVVGRCLLPLDKALSAGKRLQEIWTVLLQAMSVVLEVVSVCVQS